MGLFLQKSATRQHTAGAFGLQRLDQNSPARCMTARIVCAHRAKSDTPDLWNASDLLVYSDDLDLGSKMPYAPHCSRCNTGHE